MSGTSGGGRPALSTSQPAAESAHVQTSASAASGKRELKSLGVGIGGELK